MSIQLNDHRALLGLAIPISVGAMVQTSYHLVNAFWVGRIGADALAVVSICFPINLLMVSLGSGLSLGGSVLIAQQHGAGNQAQVNKFAAQSVTTLVILALLLSSLGFLAAPRILQLLGAGDTIYPSALAYLRITFIGSVFSFLCMAYQAILRALGEAKAPLLIVLPSVAVNAVLDPILIFGWGPVEPQGVEGAAVATVITQAITAGAGILLMLKPRYGLRMSWRAIYPQWPEMGKILRLGYPAAIEQSMGALTVTVITVLAATFGTLALASYGIVFRIMTFVVIPAYGISMATSILLGQNLGAGNVRSARRIAVAAATLGFTLMGTAGVCLFIAAESIAGIFAPGDPQLIEHCALVLRIFVLGSPLSGIQMAMYGAFRGAGATMSALVLTLTGIWVIQMPLCVVLSQYNALGEMGLWWSSFIAATVNTLIAVIYFRSNRWQGKLASGS